MKIGIDARLYGLEHTGIGRYVMELVKNVLKHDKKNHYVLFMSSKYAPEYQGKKRVKVVVTNIPIYGFLEQLILPFVFYREKLDLLHVPHFNAPLLYPGKLILTVHDLIKHYSKGKDTTTRSKWLYTIKRLGYLLQTSFIAQKAAHIIVPTQYVKDDVCKMLKVSPSKISVTYEAVSGSIKEVALSDKEKKEVLAKYQLHQPFLIYTGNVYPHKNVDVLIDAVIKHNRTKEADLELAIACARSVFWDRTRQRIREKGAEDYIKLLGFVSDEDVSKLYSLAFGLVHPSKMEGFGLTGLEAMNVGLPVIAARASCLPEIYDEGALYFDPESVDDLVEKIELFLRDQDLRNRLAANGYNRVRQFSWSKMGKESVTVYNSLHQ